MGSILFFARDPGGATRVLEAYRLVFSGEACARPAALQFRAEMAGLSGAPLVLAYGPAQRIFEDAEIETRLPSPELLAPTAYPARVEFCRAFLASRGIGAVVTATNDLDEDLDHVLWEAARELGIACHAFLDHPANLARRFQRADGRFVRPNFVYIESGNFAGLLKDIGFDNSDIRDTGFLYFDRLQRSADAAASARARLRANWRAEDGDTVYLFASECGREMAEFGQLRLYDEVAMLESFAQELAGAAASLVVIRPHPRDKPGKYATWHGKFVGSTRFVVSAAGAPAEAILAADMVVGMDSTMLREAQVLGRDWRSLLPLDIRQ
jgi:hypothetical protein